MGHCFAKQNSAVSFVKEITKDKRTMNFVLNQ
ncbi:hypothetical protein Apre_1261 [Anaerococcus prevotii DSM 20548]|uniref:Uncharacterized protein n=1 Tax=Anaerococcus prevotii (strain ATCC 9321 / DSM 20548 / JCM 6508 / NCTC 11806 / PC1) TaxID=525919 RepID=C7RDM2_ANAPD|nr:hypothetical protein Apre_1261 [Anaerococcus prevotii DSM 20548]